MSNVWRLTLTQCVCLLLQGSLRAPDSCNDKEKLTAKKSSSSDPGTGNGGKGSVKKQKKSSLKKVHFERSGSKDKAKSQCVEEPESGISKGEVSSGSDAKNESKVEANEVDNGYDTDEDDKTEEDRLTGEKAKANLEKEGRKCCIIL